MVDHRRARLDHHVAEAADAWMTDPADTGAYARLVSAVTARRAYMYPPLLEREAAPHEEGVKLPERLGGNLAGLDPRAVIAGLLADRDGDNSR